jgi:hypothetical protein
MNLVGAKSTLNKVSLGINVLMRNFGSTPNPTGLEINNKSQRSQVWKFHKDQSHNEIILVFKILGANIN